MLSKRSDRKVEVLFGPSAFLVTLTEEQIRDRNVTIGVVGLGYVGLPMSVEFTRVGFRVNGYDIAEDKISQLREGTSYVEYLSDAKIQTAIERNLSVSSEASHLDDCDVIIIAVPTGLENNSPNMTPLKTAVETVAAKRKGDRETLYIIASTVYPGAVDEIVKPSLERGGQGLDSADIAVVPERIDPGKNTDLYNIPVVAGADDERTRVNAAKLFKSIASDVHPANSTKIAAAAKLLENTYRLINISLINEFAMFAEKEGIDVWKIIEAASTKPFGFEPFYPSAGAGGQCIPVDPVVLAHRAYKHGIRLNTIETATEINQSMPDFVVETLSSWLSSHGKELKKSRVHIMGLSYKPNVGDLRNSAASLVCDRIAARSRSLKAYDPLIPESDTNLPEGASFSRRPSPDDVMSGDVIAYLVDHSEFDISAIKEKNIYIFDVTNSLDGPWERTRTLGSVETTSIIEAAKREQ